MHVYNLFCCRATESLIDMNLVMQNDSNIGLKSGVDIMWSFDDLTNVVGANVSHNSKYDEQISQMDYVLCKFYSPYTDKETGCEFELCGGERVQAFTLNEVPNDYQFEVKNVDSVTIQSFQYNLEYDVPGTASICQTYHLAANCIDKVTCGDSGATSQDPIIIIFFMESTKTVAVENGWNLEGRINYDANGASLVIGETSGGGIDRFRLVVDTANEEEKL